MIYILIGPVGAGKSTIGKLLAKKLSYDFVELDELALSLSGFKNIHEAFEQSPTKFKECELLASKELSTRDNIVVACGGAVVSNGLNFDYFKEGKKPSLVIYLQVNWEMQFERLVEKHDFKENKHDQIKENIKNMNKEREYFYNLYSDVVLPTTNKNVDEIVSEIISQ